VYGGALLCFFLRRVSWYTLHESLVSHQPTPRGVQSLGSLVNACPIIILKWKFRQENRIRGRGGYRGSTRSSEAILLGPRSLVVEKAEPQVQRTGRGSHHCFVSPPLAGERTYGHTVTYLRAEDGRGAFLMTGGGACTGP